MGYLKYCTTDLQADVMQRHMEGMSGEQIAKDVGKDPGSVRRMIRLVKSRAADRGYDPEHNRTHTVSENQIISGYSDLVRYPADDPAGRIIGWIKSNRKLVDQLDDVKAIVEAMGDDLPRVPPAVYKGHSINKHHFTVVPVGDPHIGLRTWSKEVGVDWDLHIASRVYEKVFRRLFERSPDTEVCVLFNSGDFFHADNIAGETSRSGHKLDLDGRPGYWIDVGVKIMRLLVDMCLSKYKKVYFYNTPGNHDDILGLALGVFISNMYENEPRLICSKGTNPFQFFERGKVGIGFCHGHTCSLKSLPGKMADDMAEMWGRTTYRHWFTGHVHHNQWLQWKEHPGCTVESVGIIPPKDAYAHGGAYGGRRGTQLVIMDDRGYMPNRFSESVLPTD